MKTVPSTNRLILLHPEGARRFPKETNCPVGSRRRRVSGAKRRRTDRKALWRGWRGQGPRPGCGAEPHLARDSACRVFFLKPEKEPKRARGGVSIHPTRRHPLWTPPLSPGLVRVIELTDPQTPRGGGPLRERSDGVRVRRRSAARRNCRTGAGMRRVSVPCRNRQSLSQKSEIFVSSLYTRVPF